MITIIQFGFGDTKFMSVQVTDSLDDKLPNKGILYKTKRGICHAGRIQIHTIGKGLKINFQ